MSDTISAAALATLRPGDPVARLVAMMGSSWRPPAPHREGLVDVLAYTHGFSARITTDGRIGEVRFDRRFDPTVVIEGLSIQMPTEDLATARPDITLGGKSKFGPPMQYGYAADETQKLSLSVNFDKVYGIALSDPNATYPEKLAPQYPAFDAVPGAPFADRNLKLAVIGWLLMEKRLDLGEPAEFAAHVLGREVDLEEEGYDYFPELHDALACYPLPPELLAEVTMLSIDASLPVYEFAWRFWDGKSDEFDITSLVDIEHCPNIRHFKIISLVNTIALSPLLKLPKLETVRLSIHDGSFAVQNEAVRELLRQRGVDVPRRRGTASPPQH